jgi:hypothetical protein
MGFVGDITSEEFAARDRSPVLDQEHDGEDPLRGWQGCGHEGCRTRVTPNRGGG